ncbi:hypothetical protein ACWC9T_36655 [Kitasatospora sp. NPDC001159]
MSRSRPRKGPSGFYRLSRGARLPPLIVDDEQAIAIALALQTAPASVTGMGDATKRALNSIKELLPPTWPAGWRPSRSNR